MEKQKRISVNKAREIGNELGLNWTKVDFGQFRSGLEVELEHGARDAETNVTGDNLLLTGKIAWAHLKEFPDYYTRLEKLESEADAYWTSHRADSPQVVPREGAHLLIVIDHREARVYRAEVHGSVPQTITPYDPHGFGRYLHYVQDESHGQRKPERKSFYEAVAKTLQGAETILLFGSGTGASSAMDQLLAELKRRHREVAERIVGCIVVDAQHLTENQLLAKARDFYAKIAAKKSGTRNGGGSRAQFSRSCPAIVPHSGHRSGVARRS
jgi:hypothetical protein